MWAATSQSPASIRQTTERATPIARATAAWLIPADSRISRNSSPNRIAARRSRRSPSKTCLATEDLPRRTPPKEAHAR